MHDIEPYYNWRDVYVSEEDEHSPFFRREYSEFEFTNTIYNFYIHPQWDSFGSPTLYLKILFADYNHHFVVMELIGLIFRHKDRGLIWYYATHSTIFFMVNFNAGLPGAKQIMFPAFHLHRLAAIPFLN